jgi:hypothetical protein
VVLRRPRLLSLLRRASKYCPLLLVHTFLLERFPYYREPVERAVPMAYVALTTTFMNHMHMRLVSIFIGISAFLRVLQDQMIVMGIDAVVI